MNFDFFLGYISYFFNSKNLHGIHSPFIYSFVKDVIYKNDNHEYFSEIEHLRYLLKKNKKLAEGWDYGKNIKSSKTISEIAFKSAKSKKYCRLLYRISKWKNPKIVIELGTSLGISSLYISKALNDQSKLYTFEGNSALVREAHSNFYNLKVENIEIIEGNFDETFSPFVEKLAEVDFVFFDGNHHKKATLNYFEICLKKSSENAVFVFDDINWSASMRQAWCEIKKHPQVNLTIDLYFIGIVFLGKRMTKENYTVRF